MRVGVIPSLMYSFLVPPISLTALLYMNVVAAPTLMKVMVMFVPTSRLTAMLWMNVVAIPP
eukprot:2644547-Pyramimonas_sp.AAC.1